MTLNNVGIVSVEQQTASSLEMGTDKIVMIPMPLSVLLIKVDSLSISDQFFCVGKKVGWQVFSEATVLLSPLLIRERQTEH